MDRLSQTEAPPRGLALVTFAGQFFLSGLPDRLSARTRTNPDPGVPLGPAGVVAGATRTERIPMNSDGSPTRTNQDSFSCPGL